MSGRRRRYSAHALTVMRRRDVTRTEVGLVVDEPDETYVSEGRTVHRRGPLAVVTEPDGTVVTVLLSTSGVRNNPRWRDVDVRTRPRLPEV